MRRIAQIIETLIFVFAFGVSLAMASGSTPYSDDKSANAFICNANMVYIAPVIDGVFDDPVWEEQEESILGWNSTVGIPWNGNQDFQGRFKIVWKGSTIYIALSFIDDRVEIASSDLSRRDSVEIYLDIERNARRTHSNRYTIPFGETKPFDNEDRVYAVWGDDGTTFEASFSLDITPEVGAVIGFDIAYNDIDGDYQKEINWASNPDNPQNPRLGDLTFSGLGSQAVRKMSTTWGKIKSLY